MKQGIAPRVCRAVSQAARATTAADRVYLPSSLDSAAATCLGLHEQTRRDRWRPRTDRATNEGVREASVDGLALDWHCAFLRAWQRRLCFAFPFPLLDELITTSITHATTAALQRTHTTRIVSLIACKSAPTYHYHPSTHAPPSSTGWLPYSPPRSRSSASSQYP